MSAVVASTVDRFVTYSTAVLASPQLYSPDRVEKSRALMAAHDAHNKIEVLSLILRW